MKKIFLFFLLIFAIEIGYSQEKSLGNDNNNSQIQTISMNNNEIEILKHTVEAYKDSFDRVNSTYQWAMGIIFTVIVAFLGVTGYNYHKNYKNDLQKIKEELEQAYQKKVEELIQRNSKSLNSSLEIKENRWNQKFLILNYEFLTYKFDKEESERQKLSISLKILNVLSEGNWNYTDGAFKKYFIFIEDCCKKQIYFDHSEFDDVKEMLSKLPERFEKEKTKLEAVINYE